MAKKTADPPKQAAPLWQMPLPVIGLTGEYASGKTLFGLTIAPGKDTRVYDTEKSSASYISLGFDRVDVPAEMGLVHPKGYKPVDTFRWWRKHVQSITPGQFRVIVLDTASEIESGLFDYVSANPAEFGRTPAQYAKSSAMVWGDVKEMWKAMLSDLASRCETFVFTVHLRQVWAGNQPTLKKAPKGKSTLEELASLYLWMERKPDAKGNVPAIPSAIVRKTRLAYTRIDPDTGEVKIQPILTPRLPFATPTAIRRLMAEPPDGGELSADERAPEEVLSEDDRLELATRKAEAEAEAERLRSDRESRLAQRIAAKPRPAPVEEPDADQADEQQAEPAAAPTTPAAAPTEGESHPSAGLGVPIAREQLERLAELRDELFRVEGVEASDRKTAWSAILAKRNVTSARDLNASQAGELIERLLDRIAKRKEEQAEAESGGD